MFYDKLIPKEEFDQLYPGVAYSKVRHWNETKIGPIKKGIRTARWLNEIFTKLNISLNGKPLSYVFLPTTNKVIFRNITFVGHWLVKINILTSTVIFYPYLISSDLEIIFQRNRVAINTPEIPQWKEDTTLFQFADVKLTGYQLVNIAKFFYNKPVSLIQLEPIILKYIDYIRQHYYIDNFIWPQISTIEDVVLQYHRLSNLILQQCILPITRWDIIMLLVKEFLTSISFHTEKMKYEILTYLGDILTEPVFTLPIVKFKE